MRPPYIRALTLTPVLLCGHLATQIPQDNGIEVVAATASGAGAMHSLLALDPFAGVNDLGQVAMTGRLPGQAGEQLLLFDTDGSLQVASFATSSSNRDFAGASLSSAILPLAPFVASRDRVSGAPPAYRVRSWRNGVFSIIGRSPQNFDSASLWLDVNDSGVVAFTGLQNGSTILFAGDIEPPTPVASFAGSQQIRPQIANTNEIVYRSPTGAIQLIDAAPFATPTTIAGPGNGFVDVGNQPGISDDGSVVAFTGDQGLGAGLFAAITNGSGYQVVQLDGPGANYRFSSVVLASRVGVAVSDDLGGRLATVTYIADDNGIRRLATVQAHVDGSTQTVAARRPRVLLSTGELLGTETVQSLFLSDPIGAAGWVAAGAGVTGGNAVVRYSPLRERPVNYRTDFVKYKQFLGAWADLCTASGMPAPCPGTSDLFRREGCTMTSFATAVSASLRNAGIAMDVDPLQVRNSLANQGLIYSNGAINLATASYTAITPDGHYARVSVARDPGDDYDTILTELRAGRPVILAVPSASNYSGNTVAKLIDGRVHYVVAYGYDEDAGLGESQGILINDPGYGSSRYGGPAGQLGSVLGFGSALDRDVHVTLHDYFAAVTRTATALRADYRGAFGNDPARDNQRIREWFDDGRFYHLDQNGAVTTATVTMAVRKRLIAKTKLLGPVPLVSALPAAAPIVKVGSPVELRLVPPQPATPLATDPAVLQPGDTLIEKIAQLRVLPPDASYLDLDPQFPPYAVELPASLAAQPLSIEIIGVGNGPYEVTYAPRDVTIAPESTTGTAATGSTSTLNVSAQTQPCGGNPADSLTLSGVPALGSSVNLLADNPLATQSPGAMSVFVFANSTDPNEPCGRAMPGFGMAGPGASGEVLVSNQFACLPGSMWNGSAQLAVFTIGIPAAPNLIGTVVYCQSALVDLAPGATVPIGLTNRVRIEVIP